jgi:hypothetical protein
VEKEISHQVFVKLKIERLRTSSHLKAAKRECNYKKKQMKYLILILLFSFMTTSSFADSTSINRRISDIERSVKQIDANQLNYRIEKDLLKETYPKMIKKRFEINIQNEDWIPFYVGKSEKVRKRIWEHLNLDKKHATCGLKFNERSNFKLKNKINLGYCMFPVDEKIPSEIKQFIITNFESEIRKKLNPWIGKQ